MIHDTIHGSFYLPNIAWHIVDTPQYQRLRYIKQTGNASYVYPGSEHTRFQHGLGVAYLCLQFGKMIKSEYDWLISDHDILLLCLAGLCHDLGHCAYSHLYEKVIHMFDSDSTFTHEEGSIRLLLDIYHNSEELREQLTLEDIYSVSKMILGSQNKVTTSFGNDANLSHALRWTDRDHEKAFLYEIVSNGATGTDVDKFDYLKRDSHYTGIQCAFDPQRLMAFFQIQMNDDKSYHITYRNKGDELIKSMWTARDDLHRRVYQHRVVKCVDKMMLEMIGLCGDEVVCDGVMLRDAHRNMKVYSQITDYRILALIERVPKARALLLQLQRRALWPTLAVVVSTKNLEFDLLSYEDVKMNVAHFKGEYRYYFFDTSHDADSTEYKFTMKCFYEMLISRSEGASIFIKDPQRGTTVEIAQ